ncbi:MAG: Rne/Rng family ribonuclease [Ignavibacteria bacterium]|nr:Rne/Rng family ribonuclease [Ignavibacteria bacterium]
MVKEIIINASASQTRVAITEEGNLVDFFVDYPETRRMVGDIYLGKVARVLPGIKAAFIDIGMKHDAFLHFSDIGAQTKDLQAMLDEDDEPEEIEQAAPVEPELGSNVPEIQLINGVPKLHKGQEILIQITKEPVVNKGVRVSSAISIPGRFCVLLPYDNKIGVSKKITDFRERKRLKSIARSIIPKNYGLIIRTVARNQDEESLREDLHFLKKIWEDIVHTAKVEKPPRLVYQDLSTTISVIRDLFTNEVSKIHIDNRKLYKQVRDYLQTVHPDWLDRLDHYKSMKPIFEAFGVEEQVKSLFARKVHMKSGGYIVIEHTEAMVVIDVNSGKYAANKEQELNSLKTDLEAAREIVRQLRLRDIGGLIVVDFIDLEDEKNRKKIYDELKKEFKKDRAKVSVLPMSDFGLIQITRQRVRQNIMQAVTETCPSCHGTGLLVKKSQILYEIEEWLKRYRFDGAERFPVLKCHPSIAEKLLEGFPSMRRKMQFKYFVFFNIQTDETISVDQFKFYSRKTKEDITEFTQI